LTVGQNWLIPQAAFQKKYQFKDDFSYSLNSHDIKLGGSVQRVDPLGFETAWGNNGSFYYADDGDPVDAALEFTWISVLPPADLANTQFGLYLQDDWRVKDSLSLNLGIRYDVEIGTLSGIKYGEAGNLLIHDPRSPYFGQGMPKDDKNNVAPRVGFAWDVGPEGKTVLRGGWGLFF
jgi:outer membrane receptor protein involved in Fe transport